MISFVALLHRLWLFLISLIPFPSLVLIGHISFVFALALCGHFLSRSRATIRGLVVGHLGFSLSLSYQSQRLDAPNLYTRIILAGPPLLFLPCPFYHGTYLLFNISSHHPLYTDTLFDIHLLIGFLLCVPAFCLRVFRFPCSFVVEWS